MAGRPENGDVAPATFPKPPDVGAAPNALLAACCALVPPMPEKPEPAAPRAASEVLPIRPRDFTNPKFHKVARLNERAQTGADGTRHQRRDRGAEYPRAAKRAARHTKKKGKYHCALTRCLLSHPRQQN